MPLLVNDYSWKQTEELVIIHVPLRNKQPHEVDLFTSSKYIKAHYSPYLFEAALNDEIDEESSKCVVKDDHIVFELSKKKKTEWLRLTKDLSKQQLIQLKEDAILEVHEKSEKLKNDRKITKAERQSACVSHQLAFESEARKSIKNKKEELKSSAVEDFMNWKKTETNDHATLLPLWKKLENQSLTEVNHQEVNDQTIFECEPKTKQTKYKRLMNLSEGIVGNPIPPSAPVRTFFRIKCNFTPRSFPTPMRESKFKEEEEWLSKQAEARRQTGFVAEDLKPEENNPEWLLEKGKSFHEVKNYLGAVSALSHAIQTWKKIPELYCARATTQLCLGNWRRVIFDTTECLDLCKPHVDNNADMRFACHLHRGQALLEINKGKAALADFEEALELHPKDGRLEHFIDRAESAIAEEACQNNAVGQKKPQQLETKYLSPSDLAN